MSRAAREGTANTQPRPGLAARLRASGDALDRAWHALGRRAIVAVARRAVPFGIAPSNRSQALAQLFPHVDFKRLRPADAIRVSLQVVWLALIRPQAPQPADALGYPAQSLKFLQGWLLDAVRPIEAARVHSVGALDWLAERLLPRHVWHGASDSADPAAGVRAERAGPLTGEQAQDWTAGQASTRAATQAATRAATRAQNRARTAAAIGALAERCAAHPLWRRPLVRLTAFAIGAVLIGMCITTPFSMQGQIVFLVCLWAVAMLVRRVPGHLPILLLIVLSVTASTRYVWWRVTNTLNWDEPFDLMWGIVLLGAEIYMWIVLLLGYVQSAWPLKRTPLKLPQDAAQWPSVDVYIPTYNEPLSVVRPTVFAAMGIDWPADKLNIYLLDDGRRDAFRDFAAECAISYMARPDNLHAKAGNLNHALARSDGEYIAIFDCDHIPTRSFLQVTMGWFIGDPKMALLQTPHHFFSPDPFERNLGVFRNMPNEGELFYGVVQDGNDLWNATFFCGSCAIMKRGPLVEVGGIAIETVTEDAHTALKMQRLGYKSAYLNIPLAAGLATESLSAHIGQRVRWARGMAQIFRLDNPFLGKGLSWAQRACYGNSMMHFFNGGPRLIFLTAPLAFLVFHAYVIDAPALMVLLFVMPHMVHASLANSRIQGKHRHSFWAEVYETVLAWYIVRPTTAALIDPHRGRFNVTGKGGLVENRYFDWSITTPYVITVGLNLVGLCVGAARLFWGPVEEAATTWLNLFWTLYNLLILGAAIAVALEARQQRRSHRVQIALPALLRLADGKLLRCRTVDFSEGGASLALDPADTDAELATALSGMLVNDAVVGVSLWRGNDEHQFPAQVTASTAGNVRVRWNLRTRAQEIALVQCTFSRADAWVSWADGRRADRPLAGLFEVLRVGLSGYRRMIEYAPASVMPAITAVRRTAGFFHGLLPRQPVITMQAQK